MSLATVLSCWKCRRSDSVHVRKVSHSYPERDRGVSRVTLGCPGGVPGRAYVGEGVRGYDSLGFFTALYQENP